MDVAVNTFMPIISYRALQRYISRKHIIPNVFRREMEFTAWSNDCRVCYKAMTARQPWSATVVSNGHTVCAVLVNRIRSTAELWRTCVMVPRFHGPARRVRQKQRATRKRLSCTAFEDYRNNLLPGIKMQFMA